MTWTPSSLSPAMRATLSHLTRGYELRSRVSPYGARYWLEQPASRRRIALDRITVEALQRRGLIPETHLTDGVL